MAKTWTAERDQKLLLLLLDQINVTGGIAAAAAKAWKTNYVDTNKDTYQPTARAVTEHLNQLKASVYGKGSGGTPKAKVTPKSTPRKAPATKTKTPTRGTKRKRGKMSDEDEDDDMGEEEDNTDAEREMLETTPSNSRSSLPRRSKVAKSYQQDDDSSDDDEENEDDDAIDGEYDVDADLEKSKATRSKSRPSPSRPSKSAAALGHEGDDGGENIDDDHLEDAEIAASGGSSHVSEQVEAESHHQNDEGSDEDEDANLPKVTVATPMAQEEGVNFFAAKDSAETDRLVQTQRVTKERSLNASSGGIDLFWIRAPLMSYRPDIWSGLVLALVWITQMLVVPFELMIIAALIWDVQGEGNPVPAGYFVYLTCILTCIVLTALEIAFWMVDALHPYTFLGFQVFKAGFWLVFFPIGIATTVMMRVIASGLLWDFWWIFQTVFLSLGFTATIAALIYGAWVAHTYKD